VSRPFGSVVKLRSMYLNHTCSRRDRHFWPLSDFRSTATRRLSGDCSSAMSPVSSRARCHEPNASRTAVGSCDPYQKPFQTLDLVYNRRPICGPPQRKSSQDVSQSQLCDRLSSALLGAGFDPLAKSFVASVEQTSSALDGVFVATMGRPRRCMDNQQLSTVVKLTLRPTSGTTVLSDVWLSG